MKPARTTRGSTPSQRAMPPRDTGEPPLVGASHDPGSTQRRVEAVEAVALTGGVIAVRHVSRLAPLLGAQP